MLHGGEPGSGWIASGIPAPRRPLILLALLIIAGTAAGLAFSLPFPVVALTAIICAGLAGLLPRRTALAPLAVSVAAVAFLRAGLSSGDPSEITLHRVTDGREEGVSVLGTVAEDPVRRTGFDGEQECVFACRVEALNRTGTWQRVRGRVTCTVRSRDLSHAPAYGDRWILKGTLRPGQGRLLGFEGERVGRHGGSRIMRWCVAGRHACAAALGRGLEGFPTHHALLKALLLGYRDELPGDLRNAFSVTGTLHMFAISGLHVGVLVGLFAGLLNTVGVPRHRWVLFLAPAVILYTMATGLRPSAVRACVMALCYWLSAVAWRRPDGPSALALAAVVMLLWAPMQLLDPGFILSFAVVAGLLLLAPPLQRAFLARLGPDPWAPPEKDGPTQWARNGAVWLAGALAFSLVAWTASLPLTATFFNIFSPVAVVGNLLVVPAAFVVVSTGCLSVLAAPFSGFVAEVFNHANRVVIDLLLGFVDLMAAVPGGHRFVRAPHPCALAAWYTLLAAWALARPTRKSRRVLGLATVALLAAWGWLLARTGPLEVNVLDARGGVVVHLDAGQREHVLVNTGSAYHGPRLARYLRSRGVNRLVAVVAGSASPGDTAGLASLQEVMPMDEFWVPPGVRTPTNLPPGVRVRSLVRGEAGFLADGTAWRVLSPPARMGYANRARAAPIMLFGRDGLAAVYVGGWDPVKARELEGAGIETRAPVLIWGARHAPPVAPGFEQFAPDWVILSVKPFRMVADDYAPFLGEPTGGPGILRTDEGGGIRLRSRPARWRKEGYGVLRLD